MARHVKHSEKDDDDEHGCFLLTAIIFVSTSIARREGVVYQLVLKIVENSLLCGERVKIY